MTTGVVVSWVRHHGRSEGLADALGYSCVFIHEEKGTLLWRYLRQAHITWRLIRKSQFSRVIVMLPPFPALMVVILAASKNQSVAADLHTGFFLNPKWRWASGFTLRMLRGRSAIVTNAPLARKCEEQGVEAIVLHDVLEDRSSGRVGFESARESVPPQIVCPLGYANDEPIEELIEVFGLLPEYRFVLTGNAPAWIRGAVPSNVTFPGYLSDEVYWRLIGACDGVVALTNRDLTMQRAGYEALMCRTPHITSDFTILRDFYEDAAIYTRLDPDSIVSSLRQVIDDGPELRMAAARILVRRIEEQHRTVVGLIGTGDIPNAGGLQHGGAGA
ncbi:hypothetical protein [Rhodococcus sp. SJ-2]